MLTAKELLGRAQALEPQLVEWRRTLHRHPEVGFDLTQTKALVKKALTEMGYEPKDCGKAGVIALAGGKKPGKTILLRGDMDALPIQEESGVNYASEVPGKMHGCGHDMHTAMMLGAAKLLKEHEEEIEGTVKLEFQPAEEIFQGSPDMISNGLLENPKVDAAVMFHVLAGMPLPLGEVLVPGEEDISDHYQINETSSALLPETADAGEDYQKETLFIGDSNTVRLYANGLVSLQQFCAKEGIGTSAALNEGIVTFKRDDNRYTIAQAVAKMKPRRVVMTFGTNDTGMAVEDFISNYKQLVQAIQTSYPYTDIIVNTVPPVPADHSNYPNMDQTRIDDFNMALLSM